MQFIFTYFFYVYKVFSSFGIFFTDKEMGINIFTNKMPKDTPQSMFCKLVVCYIAQALS